MICLSSMSAKVLYISYIKKKQVHKPIFACGFSLEMLPARGSFECFLVQLLKITPTLPRVCFSLCWTLNSEMHGKHVGAHRITHPAPGFSTLRLFNVMILSCYQLNIF